MNPILMLSWKIVRSGFLSQRWIFVLQASFAVCLFFHAYPIQCRVVVDTTQTRVVLREHPQRIVALIPSLAELAAGLLNGNLSRIVGVSHFSDFPPGLLKIESVGPYPRVNIEKILSLKSDLVLASKDGNSKDQIQHLRELGIPVLVVATETGDDIVDSVKRVAEAMGVKEYGIQKANELKVGLDEFKKKGRLRKDHPSVLFQLDSRPLVVVGKKSFLNDCIELLGAKNAYGDIDLGYPRPSFEDVIRKNPEVILIASLSGKSSSFEKNADEWRTFSSLKATQNHRIFPVVSEALFRPSLRILEGLADLEGLIYGKK